MKRILRSLTPAVMIVLAAGSAEPLQPKNTGYAGISLPASFRPFAPDSPWNTAIPENPEIDPFSDSMVRRLQAAVHRLEVSIRKWTVPLFVVDASKSPRVDVPSTSGVLFETVDPDNTGIARNIPIPEGVWPDPESDGHMVLVDPWQKKCWEFTRAKHYSDGTWSASIIDVWDLTGPGFRSPFNGRNWWRSGATGAGMPLIAGLVRPEEVEAGEISHALLCATPVNRKAMFANGPLQLCSPPASRTDGHGIGLSFIPEGARLQLDPGLDLDSLNLSRGTMILARAMQKYGMFVGMNGSTFKIFCQNVGPEGKAWQPYNYFKDLSRIPLDSFRVLKCGFVFK